MNENHLTRYFLKPGEGEYVPITFIEFRRRLVGWSPELKRSVYIENEDEKAKLKRVRETNVMIAINHISGKTAAIELKDDEKAQFEEVYDIFLKTGGQLMFTRKKIKTRMLSFFEVHEMKKNIVEAPEKSLLSERLSH